MQQKNRGATNAIVVGGGIAGIFTARVLSDHFDQVVLVERDRYGDEPVMRAGTPQGRHGHLLLSAGQQVIDRFFPELNRALQQAGIWRFTWGRDTPLHTPGGWICRADSGIESYGCSRPYLEWAIYHQLKAIENVTTRLGTLCNDFVVDKANNTVTGVQIKDKNTGEEAIIYGDLVVDTRGRGSKLPEWLEANGYGRPTETNVKSYYGYASCWFQEPEGFEADWAAIACFPDPLKGFSRGGGVLRLEDGKRVVLLTGSNRDYPPTDMEGFLAFARSLAAPEFYPMVTQAEPVTPIYGFRSDGSKMIHFDKLKRWPKHLIVLGDATCQFNPIYGQGMSAIGLEVIKLNAMLDGQDVANLNGFAHKFQKALRGVLNEAWMMSTGGDRAYPETEGKPLNWAEWQLQRYMDYLYRIMVYDEAAASAFVHVMNMRASPLALFHPRYLLKALRHRLGYRQPAVPAPTVAYPDGNVATN